MDRPLRCKGKPFTQGHIPRKGKLGFTSLLSVMSGLSSLEKVWLAGPCGLRGIDTGREYGRQHNYRRSSEHKAVWGSPRSPLHLITH